jgi:hypothetical protein
VKPFTKLFASIISSSIWRASKDTKVVWITMLAMADKDGEVWASVGGLADMARLSREECAKSLTELLSPDEDSRTKEHDGRRIEVIDGGWRILNYKKYRELGRNEDRREYFAEHKRQSRADVHNVHKSAPMSPIAEAEAYPEAETEEREKQSDTPPPTREELQKQFLVGLGAAMEHNGKDLLGEWLKETKGMRQPAIAAIFKDATPGITWPSQFRDWRAAKVNY